MKKLLITIFFLIFLFLLFGCEKKENTKTLKEPITKNEFLLDTICNITLYDSDEKTIDEAFDYVRKYENLLSRTVENSDISNINKNSGKKSVEVNKDTLEVIRKGIEYGDLTNGKFDITIEPISSLWNFGQKNAKVPDISEINSSLPLINYKDISIKNNSVFLSKENQGIDLGAIAKGYIADKTKDFLLKKGVKSGVLDFGGNVICIGNKPDGNKFKIGIQDPFKNRNKIYGIIDVSDKSVVTSGIYERFIEKDGIKYHHILDPKTGMPFENNIEQVTIISKNSVDGDGLSTSLFALGIEDGLNLIDSLNGVDAIFITKDNKVYKSKDFDAKYNYRNSKKN